MEEEDMRILVVGSSGLLGEKLARLASERGIETHGTYLTNPANLDNRVRLDVTDRRAVQVTLQRLVPDVVVDCVAVTDVDRCEREKDLATAVNAEAAGYMAEASKSIGAHLIYVSTDYVFDGMRGMYREDDQTSPVNHYGFSKLQVEKKVASMASSWCIARTSVVFGWGREKRPNFATWILQGLRGGRRLNVVTDQYASPTLNTSLAAMLLGIAERRLRGTYHVAGRDRVDRYTMATLLAHRFGLDERLLSPVKSSSIDWLAKRPIDSSLDVGKALKELAAKPLTLEEALTEMEKTEKLEKGMDV